MTDEFALIDTCFRDIGRPGRGVAVDIGDDAAVLTPPAGRQLVAAMDTLVESVHFDDRARPEDIGYKALAVNLSDLAAMGADPEWFLLSLTLPEADVDWVRAFAGGLDAAASTFGGRLVGGDTCRGPLSISIQVTGTVPAGEFVSRAGAGAGDLILVSGELGNAALGLAARQQRLELPAALADKAATALHRPRPRLELVDFLRRHASAAIDISDGLVGDLGHLLERSGCGARLRRAALPVDDWVRRRSAWDFALAGGDDYEICFSLPSQARDSVDDWNRANPDCRLTEIGEIVESGYRIDDDDGEVDLTGARAYRHFN